MRQSKFTVRKRETGWQRGPWQATLERLNRHLRTVAPHPVLCLSYELTTEEIEESAQVLRELVTISNDLGKVIALVVALVGSILLALVHRPNTAHMLRLRRLEPGSQVEVEWQVAWPPDLR